MSGRRGAARLTTSLAAMLLIAGVVACQSGGTRPAEIPAAVVVVPGEQTSVVTASENNWSFAVTVESATAQDRAVTELTNNGFEIVDEQEGDDARVVALANESAGVEVTLRLEPRGDQYVVSYNVLQR